MGLLVRTCDLWRPRLTELVVYVRVCVRAQSGSLVHLQLVQFHPGLCEIGSNWEENQMLIEEQRQLLAKLKVHTCTYKKSSDWLSCCFTETQDRSSICDGQTSKDREQEDGQRDGRGGGVWDGGSVSKRGLDSAAPPAGETTGSSDTGCRVLQQSHGGKKLQTLQNLRVDWLIKYTCLFTETHELHTSTYS